MCDAELAAGWHVDHVLLRVQLLVHQHRQPARLCARYHGGGLHDGTGLALSGAVLGERGGTVGTVRLKTIECE